MKVYSPNSKMDLSIIIVSYNTKDLTLSCIKSILADTSVGNKEIIVVDNGSSDDSIAVIEKFKSQNSKYKINFIKNKNNLGFSKANNQGIKIAKGKYTLLLNSDTKIKKGSLGKLIKFAKIRNDAGVVGPRLLNKDGSLQESCLNIPTLGRAIKQYWLGQGKPLDKFAPKKVSPTEVEAIVGAAFLITPLALKKVGGLDERYFFFYEDLEYCRKVHENGLKVYYLPDVEIFHYHGASGKSLAGKSDQWRRLIPSSKIYHGTIKHYVFNFILWSGQKWEKIIKN